MQFLSQSNKNPSQHDWNAAKRVFRYLKGMRNLGIIYRRDLETGGAEQDHVTPWRYCDINYAEDPCDRKSTSRYSFMLMGGPIARKSKKQALVALSTTKGEYYALGITCQAASWIQQICQELFMNLDNPTCIYSDNIGAVALSDNPIFHNRSKHINICWHFIQNLICSKAICTSHIPGTQNRAYFLTKALNWYEHEHCIKLLRVE